MFATPALLFLVVLPLVALAFVALVIFEPASWLAASRVRGQRSRR